MSSVRLTSSTLALARVVVIAAVVLSSAPVRAWTPIASSRPIWCDTAPYSMNAAGSPDLGSMSETIVQQGMDDWSRVSCTGLTTRYMGTTSRTPGSYEGTSTVGWIESGWRHSSSAIGVTGPRWGGSCIIEADMELNGVNYRWITGPGSGGSVNAYSIILHEGGHYYGLGHSSDPNATMYYAYTGGIDSLNSDDQAGICALYPGDGSVDCTTTGCPSGQECVDGSCRTVTGDGTVCSPCSTSSDCGGSSDYCLAYPDGGGYCGKACSSDADCEGTDMCFSTSGGASQCVRVDSSGNPNCSASPTPDCRTDADCSASERCDTSTGSCVPRPTGGAGLGEPCTANEDCNSSLCFFTPSGGVCSQSCNWLNTTSCPSGFYCDGDATGSCGSGVCLAGTAGTAALGQPCSEDTDCASLMCSLGECAEPCIPGGTAGCDPGYACQVGAVPGCGACKMAAGTGAPCEVNEDCASRLCARDGDRTFCTELCTDASTCPEGSTCDPAGDVSVCNPPPIGGPGDACESNEDCASLLCARDGERTFCTELCTDASTCPEGFACEAAGDVSVCTPPSGGRGGGGGCGCLVVGAARDEGTPRGIWWAAGLLVASMVARRRARDRR